jgi:ferredoxin-thioredoxin reductase catalytic subunit
MSLQRKELTPEEALKGAIQFSERYVARGPYRFFPEPEVVKTVQQGLADNQLKHGYRYCP